MKLDRLGRDSIGLEESMRRYVRLLALALFSFSLSAVIGCGRSGTNLHEVKGKVEVDGKPAGQALVFMHRKERNALTDPLPYGTCEADGSFAIETPNVGKGVQEGEYTITVYWPDMSKPEDGNGQRPDVLNGAYEMADKSKITATVKAGVNELPVMKLVPGPPKARPASDKNNK